MIKKVASLKLQPGMFVHRMDCSWLQHPFFRNQFMIEHDSTIEKIVAAGIHEVYIDTERGIDESNAPTWEEARKQTETRIRTLAEVVRERPHRVSLEEERRRALMLRDEASIAMRATLEAFKEHKQVNAAGLKGVAERMIASVSRNPDAFIPLARLKSRDHYAYEHSVSVAGLMAAFALHVGMQEGDAMASAIGALLHDVGRINLSDRVLEKQARLTDAEVAHLRSHVVQSVVILQHAENVSKTAMDIVTQHHERLDGSGYPNHLKAEAISRAGQMAAIVDAYDGMTSDRPDRPAMAPTTALRKLYEWSEHHYSRELVQQFIEMLGVYPVGSLVRLENGLLGVVLEQNRKSMLKPRVRVFFDTRKNTYVRPLDVDLASKIPFEYAQIVSVESFQRWGIDPNRWLPL